MLTPSTHDWEVKQLLGVGGLASCPGSLGRVEKGMDSGTFPTFALLFFRTRLHLTQIQRARPPSHAAM